MKPTMYLKLMVAAIVGAIVSNLVAESGAGYKLNSSSCDAGGSCAGGKFKMSCAVGQPEAGVSTATTCAVYGGFLSVLQKPALPPLTIVRTRTEYFMTWPNAAEGLHLDWTQDLKSWADLGEGTLVGDQRQARIPVFNANLFFRLRKDCPK
jgi:hypothetical protein